LTTYLFPTFYDLPESDSLQKEKYKIATFYSYVTGNVNKHISIFASVNDIQDRDN